MKTKPRKTTRKPPSGRDPKEPMAHFFHPGNPRLALCGEKLKGEKARKDIPLCVVCKGLKDGGAAIGYWR